MHNIDDQTLVMLGSFTDYKANEVGSKYWVGIIQNLASFPWYEDGKLLMQLMQLVQSWHSCIAQIFQPIFYVY